MELPVNKLITLIIFLVVLLAIVYFIFGVGKTNNQYETDIRNCCQAYRANNCDYKKDILCPSGEQLSNLVPMAGYTEELLNSTCMC